MSGPGGDHMKRVPFHFPSSHFCVSIGEIQRVLDKQLQTYQQNPKLALDLLRVGESARDQELPAAELAAYTIVASMILNLDEVVTKN